MKQPGAAKVIADRLAGGGSPNQSDLARALDVTPTTVGRWIRGESRIRPQYHRAIEVFLELPAGTLAEAGDAEPVSDVERLKEAVAQLSAEVAELGALMQVILKRLDH